MSRSSCDAIVAAYLRADRREDAIALLHDELTADNAVAVAMVSPAMTVATPSVAFRMRLSITLNLWPSTCERLWRKICSTI